MKGVLESNSIKILKGTLIACILTLALLFIYSVILTYTKIGEDTMAPVIILITGISILAGSSIGTSKIKKNGILNGGIIGLIYILVIYLLSSITGGGFELNMYSSIMIISAIVAGAVRRNSTV